jgi:hypothetical protein
MWEPLPQIENAVPASPYKSTCTSVTDYLGDTGEDAKSKSREAL